MFFFFFFPRDLNFFLATVVPTCIAKSDHIPALKPTLADTEVMTYYISFCQGMKSTIHHLFGIVWKISEHQLSEKYNSQQQLQSNLLSLGLSALVKTPVPLNKVLYFLFMVMIFNKGSLRKKCRRYFTENAGDMDLVIFLKVKIQLWRSKSCC